MSIDPEAGRWERHLARKRDNPLFPEPDRAVTHARIMEAKRKDAEEAQAFRREFESLFSEAAGLAPQVDTEVVLKLRERIDRLYDRCAALGPSFEREKTALNKLYDVIAATLHRHAGADPMAAAELEEEEAARAAHVALLAEPLVAELLLPDSPVSADELVPTLLSCGETSLRAVLPLFDADQQTRLCQDARELLQRLRSQGHESPEAWARLDLMERHLNDWLRSSHEPLQ
jgi:hypothetical protein